MAVQNSLVKKQQSNTFSAYITQDAIKNKINQMVGSKDGQRFITSIISAVSTNPTLAECDHGSILSAAMVGEALKLSPSPQLGQYYLVPYQDKKRNCKVAQFQLGAKGYKQLAMRSGQYLDIDVIEIKAGEYLGRDKYTGKHKFEFIEDEVKREELETIGYLAYFELLNGFKKTLYWTKEKMEKHADSYSQSFSLEKYKQLQEGKIPKDELWKYSSFWYKSFSEMAEKTMIRQLISKWGIMSIDMQNALEKDMAVINESGVVEYVDNVDFNDVVDVPQPETIEPEIIEPKEEPKKEPKTKQKAAEALDDFFNQEVSHE
jgi:recombination protein RecT